MGDGVGEVPGVGGVVPPEAVGVGVEEGEEGFRGGRMFVVRRKEGGGFSKRRKEKRLLILRVLWLG